jgi:hypothetical protein
VDEGTAAHVDERAVVRDPLTAPSMCGGAGSFTKVFIVNVGIIVHRSTSVYISMNEV